MIIIIDNGIIYFLEVPNAKDKEKKYHVFRTILRKHNVSGRENAFDILVNLFLCKIVDETHQFFAANMNAKDFEKLIKEKKNEIIKKHL